MRSSEDHNTNVFTPQGVDVEIEGEKLRLFPVRMKQLPAFSESLGELLPLLIEGDLVRLVTLHYAKVRKLLSVWMGKDEAWFDELLPDAFLFLLTKLVELNSAFFFDRFLPMAGAIGDQLARVVTKLQDGPKS